MVQADQRLRATRVRDRTEIAGGADVELFNEELSVAEEELRVQQELLDQSRITLEHERARYRELFEQAPVAYVITDAEGLIETANSAASSALRIRPNNLVGKPLAVFVY